MRYIVVMPIRYVIALIVLAVTALVLFQLVTRIAVYELYLDDWRHAATNYPMLSDDFVRYCMPTPTE